MEISNIKDLISSYKNKILNLLIIIVALFFAYNIFKSQVKNIAALKERRDTETKKNTVLEKIRESEKKINAYKNLINNKDVSLVMNTVSEIAKDFSINILSIKPQGAQDYSLYIKYSFNLKIEVNNYHSLGEFISKLESHPHIYNVEAITASPESISPEGDIDKLITDLKISTILLKD